MVKDTSEYEYRKKTVEEEKSAHLQRFVFLEKERENENNSHGALAPARVLAPARGSRHAGGRRKAPCRVGIYIDTPRGVCITRES